MDIKTAATETPYNEDYFIRGKRSGVSLYENYRWLSHLTIPMCEAITDHLEAELGETFLDFGCARGYVVKALNILGFDAVGYDISDWALENCDPDVKGLVSNALPAHRRDYVIAKDTLEHVPLCDINSVLAAIADAADKAVFIVVPLSSGIGKRYVVPDYEKDVTHVIRWPMDHWLEQIHTVFGEGWKATARYRIQGVKDNYSKWQTGNGFITCRKMHP